MRSEAARAGTGDDNKTREELLSELKLLRESLDGQVRLLEQAWLEADQKFRRLADASEAGILVYQGEDTVYLNQAMADIEGYTVEERLRMKFWAPIHPSFRDAARKRGDDRQKGLDAPARNQLKLVRKSGEERWVVSSSGTFMRNGRPAVMLIVQDITELKRAEEALKKSQYILAKAQQISHVGNWAWNVRTGQLNWSDETFRIFGYSPGDVKPTMDWVMTRVYPDDRQLRIEFNELVIRERKRRSVDYRVLWPDGSIRYVNSVADKIVIGKSGVPERVYGITQDITDRKNAEVAMSRAKNEAELYVDLMGHDINNMNQITMGYLELAHNILEFEGKLGQENVSLLEKAMDSLLNSSKLIDNVRKMQRENMGQYEPEILDVTALLEDVASQFGSVPNRDIRIDYRPQKTCMVRANALLKDVFINLIGNSIKHSSGPIAINIDSCTVEKYGGRYCQIAIEDNGPGIPDALKRTLFDRLNLATTRARGKGFGLCLIKMLVDDYGGRFWVEDRVQGDHTKGCRFIVMLPAFENK